MTETFERSELSWYDITIAGKQFNISSRRGEEHVREVERLIEKSRNEIQDRVNGQGPATTALLIALNMADRFLAMKSELGGDPDNRDIRLELLIEKMNNVLAAENAFQDVREKKDTSAEFDKLEFF